MGKFSRLGNELYTGRKSIDFVGRRWLWYAISGVIIVVVVAGLLIRGLNFGIEFTGGAEYKVSLPASQVTQANADKLRVAVAQSGVPAAAAPVVTTSGATTILVDVEPVSNAQSQVIQGAIADAVDVGPNDISPDEIGASWGDQVAKQSLIGLLVFLVLVMLFIWAYFRQWKMSVAAIVALAHDLVITIGVYALSGFEVSPATVTGLLTILGFSLYDTVVVFDKIRENTKGLRGKRTTYSAAANLAVNQTLVRSINTSLVALIPVAAILYVGVVQLGSGSLKDLALALFVGMASGAYSSIFIATPLLVQLKQGEKAVVDADRRAKQRARQADRYATVPTYKDDMPLVDEPDDDADTDVDDDEPAHAGRGSTTTRAARPQTTPEPGRGRVAPPARGPVRESGAAGRAQPTRQPRSKRGKR